jgi:tetratricopeptide (TPR) repeat protein
MQQTGLYGKAVCGGVSRYVLAYSLILLLAGCATTGEPAKNVSKDRDMPRVVDDGRAQKELQDARRMIDEGQFATVIPRLLQIISNYPKSDAAIESRYWLGIAYYKVQGYADSMTVLKEYLRVAPGGKYADAAQGYIEQQTKEYRGKYPTAEQFNGEIQALVADLKKEPGDVKKQLKLAGLFWETGDYENAGRIYEAIVRMHPELENDADVHARIERLPNDGYILLTPSEIQRREREKTPIEVLNLNSFRSGRDIFTREELYYAVSGQVRNQSASVLYGVQLVVTIYGFGNVVYDTQTVSIGRLNRGEVRAFSVRFSNFDNIENVQRYDCVATFEQ